MEAGLSNPIRVSFDFYGGEAEFARIDTTSSPNAWCCVVAQVLGLDGVD